jgi:capsular polysaccharide biosynthesis protein
MASTAPTGVCLEPPGKIRKFQRRAPEFLNDPDGVGLFTSFPDIPIVSPPIFVATAKNARLVGFRAILSQDRLFFNDDTLSSQEQRQEFLQKMAMPYPFNEETGLEPTSKIDVFALNPGRRAVERLEGNVVVLGSDEPSNYGSWLFRILPKIQTLRQVDLKEPVRYLVWVGIPSFREYLTMLGISDDLIIHQDPENFVYDLERAIVPSLRNNQAFLDPESLSLYSELRSRFGVPQEPGMRIYVSRVSQSRNGHSRAMLNEPELVERLKGMNFRIIDPEVLSVTEQIRAFSSAQMVVGPSGSGMFNIVFCHPGTKVIDIESEPHWIHAHCCLFSSCGMRYGIFVGAAEDRSYEKHHQSWRVNIEALISQIDSWSVV